MGIGPASGSGEAPGAKGATTPDPSTSLVYARTPRTVGEQVIRLLLALAAILSIATTVAIILVLVRETISFFDDVPVGDFLFGSKWTPLLDGDQQHFGVVPLLTNTLILTGIALLIAIPVGLLVAIYLAEYAPSKVRKIVKPIIELLAGVPTIVFGYFALTFFTPLLRDLGIAVDQFNGLSAGIILGLLVLPTIASVAEDAMSAVPMSLREGAFGLGASKVQVSLRIVFPAALSGIVAALILGASRAAGETVIILVASGSPAATTPSIDVQESMPSMASYIASVFGGEAATGSVEFLSVFAVGMTLFILTLILNIISIRLVRKYRQVYE